MFFLSKNRGEFLISSVINMSAEQRSSPIMNHTPLQSINFQFTTLGLKCYGYIYDIIVIITKTIPLKRYTSVQTNLGLICPKRPEGEA